MAVLLLVTTTSLCYCLIAVLSWMDIRCAVCCYCMFAADKMQAEQMGRVI